MRNLLVVVDMQNDFIDGSLGTKEAVAIVDNVIAEIAKYDTKDIFATRDTHPENYLETQEGKNLPVVHCVKGRRYGEPAKETVSCEICLPRRREPDSVVVKALPVGEPIGKGEGKSAHPAAYALRIDAPASAYRTFFCLHIRTLLPSNTKAPFL